MSRSIIRSASLLQAFLNIPRGHNILWYMSVPRTWVSGYIELINKLYGYLSMRTVFETITEHLGYAPQDSGILKKRFKFICNNNAGYILAMKDNPTVQDLEDFSKLDPCFSLLKPVKDYLYHYPEKVPYYRGMLPFGAGVIEGVNAVEGFAPKVLSTPSFSDHVRLMELTNGLADRTGMFPLHINDEFYMDGMDILSKVKKDPIED